MKFLRYFAVSAFIITLTAFSAAAATFTVTKIEDTNDGVCDADCSFREAVGAANAAAGDDVIEFSSLFDTAQTITLTGSEIVIGANGSLTINGPGADLLTISGNNLSRIISTGPNVVASIDGITFTAGNGVGALNTGRGGAIYNVGGTLTVSNSIITGNTAGNGGGLNNAASASPSTPANLTLINCVFSNNTSSSSGGAMQNFSTSTLNMRDTTVSGNTSNGTGIAAAFQANGTVTITNSTFSGNNAPTGTGGGVYYNGTTSLTMTNTTISGNSSLNGAGGLHRTGTTATATVRNSIIAGNNGNAANPDAFGLLNSQGTNIIGNVLGSSGWIKSDLQNTNPMLGPLADNGGFGQTFVPMAGSPAIDGGQNCVVDLSCSAGNPPVAVTADQRGISRPQGSNVDIGSVEVVSAPSNATIIGRVLTPSGRPVSEAIITMTSAPPPTFSGIPSLAFQTRGSTLGSFIFESIPTGETYQVTAFARGYTFPVQNVQVTGDISNLVITASSESFQK